MCLPLFSIQSQAMEGSGTSEDPYQIATVEDFNEYCSLAGDTFNAKLVADISLNTNVLDENYKLNKDSFTFWDKDISINATFDGNGHSISGLYMFESKSTKKYYSLFNKVGENGIIKNLTVKDAYLGCEIKENYSSKYFGGICYEMYGQIDNCHFDGCIMDSVVNYVSYAGGICAQSYGGSISNCSFNGVMDCSNIAGGIVGVASNGTKISKCSSKGYIYSDAIASGIIGSTNDNGLFVDSCINYAKVSGHTSAAGILAYNNLGGYSSFDHCFNYGDIEAKTNSSAGITADDAKSVKNCGNEGSIIGHNYCTYGIAYSCDSIISCYNTGTIKGHDNVAGICGSVYKQMRYCVNSGTIVATGENVAGVCVYYGIDNDYSLSALSYNTGDVTGRKNVAGFTAEAKDGIAECFNTGNITADTCAAGIVPDISSDHVSTSFNTGTITAKYKAYGIASRAYPMSCFNAGVVKADTLYEPLVSSGSHQVRCVYNKDIYPLYSDDYYYKGEGLSTEEILDIKVVLSKLGGTGWCMNVNQNAKMYYPHIEALSGIVEAVSYKDVEFDENGFCKEHPSIYQPAPIVDGVVQISNGGQLFWFQEKVNYDKWSVDAILMNDIIIESDTNILNIKMLSDVAYTPSEGFHEWRPIGYTTNGYSATFDGRGHSISRLVSYTEGHYTSTEYNAGLFSNLNAGGCIKNLTIENSYISTLYSFTAGIVATNRGEVKNCILKNSLLKGSLGGHTGTSRLTAGICCKNHGLVDSVEVISSVVFGLSDNGGIVSENFGTVSNSSFSGTVISKDNDAAGVVCVNYGSISGCANHGAVSGYSVGGVCYYNDDSAIIENCVNTNANFHYVNDPHTAIQAGGICTYNSSYFDKYGLIINCHNTASADSISFTGVCHYNRGHIVKCWNEGNITNASGIGGISGTNNGTIEYCYNLGNIKGIQYVGGITASMGFDAITRKCMNFGEISGTETYIGGIVGSSSTSKVSNCANWGRVSGADNVGGIIGGGFYIDSCYSVGSVTGAGENIGCIFGKNESTYAKKDYITTCYANEDSCNTSNGHDISIEEVTVYLPTSEMLGEKAKDNMTVLDFNSIWCTVDGGFPMLIELKDYEKGPICDYIEIENNVDSENELKYYSNNGIVYIMSPSEMCVSLFCFNGTLVRYITLQEGMNEVTGIEPGFYILDDKKIFIR